MFKISNKWSSALLLTFLVHGIFFIVIYTHVNLRQSHTDPLTQSTTLIRHTYDTSTAPVVLDTLSERQTITAADSQNQSKKSMNKEGMVREDVNKETTDKKRQAKEDSADDTAMQRSTKPVTGNTSSTSTSTASANRESEPRSTAQTASTTAMGKEALPRQTIAESGADTAPSIATLQAEAGLLAADTAQAPTTAQKIVTAETHNKAKAEAEAVNQELRAAIAMVKERNQQRISQSNTAVDVPTNTQPNADASVIDTAP
ncbi:hypothetical protein [Psychrobacter aestuarii]|uniref:Energy transducer TonB n=1 Tax=Psychrobacter aestuarii TaxID=556327 RepID=A0ABN0VWG5_9GAMM|nr:hypothetical protein [Psychrobacter aestuarii]